jgi:magnesium transporter
MGQTNGLVLPDELCALPADPAAIARVIIKFHAVDAAEALNGLDVARVAKVIQAMPIESVIHVFDEPHFQRAADVVEAIPQTLAVEIIAGISADSRAEIFRKLPTSRQIPLMARLDPAERQALSQLLTYPPDTAGGIMTTEFVNVPSNWTVQQTLELIHKIGRDKETVYTIYLTDPDTREMKQVVSLRQLMISGPNASVISIASNRPPITVAPLTDREEVGRLISKYNLLAIPVLAEDRHLIGIVTVDDVIDAIIAESTEDVQKFGGSGVFEEPYLQISFPTMVKKRAGWLCVDAPGRSRAMKSLH